MLPDKYSSLPKPSLSEAKKFTSLLSSPPYTNPTFSSSRRNSLTLTTAPSYYEATTVNGSVPMIEPTTSSTNNHPDSTNHSPSLTSQSSILSTFPVSGKDSSVRKGFPLTARPPSIPAPIVSVATIAKGPFFHGNVNNVPLSRKPPIKLPWTSVALRRASVTSTDSCTRCDIHHQQAAVRLPPRRIEPPPLPPVRPTVPNYATLLTNKQRKITTTKRSVETPVRNVKEDLLNEITQLNALIHEEQTMENYILACIQRAHETNTTYRQRKENTYNNGLSASPAVDSSKHRASNTTGQLYGKSQGIIRPTNMVELRSPTMMTPTQSEIMDSPSVQKHYKFPPPPVLPSRSSFGTAIPVMNRAVSTSVPLSTINRTSLHRILPSIRTNDNVLELLRLDREEIMYELRYYPKEYVLDHLSQQIQVLRHAQNRYEHRQQCSSV